MAPLLTPGVAFLLSSIPKLALPPTLVYLAANCLNLSHWTCIVAAFSAGPVLLWLRAKYRHFVEEREIRSFGAVRVPVVEGKWPGNLDLILGRLKEGKDGYPCNCVTRVWPPTIVLTKLKTVDAVEPMVRRYGRTFNTQIFGENRVTFLCIHLRAIRSS